MSDIFTDEELELLSQDARKFNKGRYGYNCEDLSENEIKEIKILLKEGKLSQRYIARIFGIDRSYVSDIKLGKRHSQITI